MLSTANLFNTGNEQETIEAVMDYYQITKNLRKLAEFKILDTNQVNCKITELPFYYIYAFTNLLFIVKKLNRPLNIESFW